LFKPSFLTIGIKSKVLESYSSFDPKSFLMAEKFSFGEGVCLNKPHLLYGMNYELWCIRMKFFVESIDRKIWNVITNSYLMPISEKISSEK